MKNFILLIALTLTTACAPAPTAEFFNAHNAYESGDFIAAANGYRALAKDGNPYAQYNLGTMYETGEGVAQDNIKAYMWFSLSARTGDKNARKNRDDLAQKMTSAQLAKADKLVAKCLSSNFQTC